MPFDDTPWNRDGGGEPNPQSTWRFTLERAATAGVTALHMVCGSNIVEFVFDDDLPAGTVIWTVIKAPCPMALVSYSLPSTDGSMTGVRGRAVPLR